MNHQTVDYDKVLDATFGKEGTEQRRQAEDKAYAFYAAQVIHNARREANVTQTELAARINSTKSYISKIENGAINPSVATFYRIIDALGMKIEILKPLV